MELTLEQVQAEGLQFLTISEFADQYHPNITFAAIRYACAKDHLDYFSRMKGKYNVRFIVLTIKTLNWKPNASKAREKKSE